MGIGAISISLPLAADFLRGPRNSRRDREAFGLAPVLPPAIRALRFLHLALSTLLTNLRYVKNERLCVSTCSHQMRTDQVGQREHASRVVHALREPRGGLFALGGGILLLG